jgi:hypothetical protein
MKKVAHALIAIAKKLLAADWNEKAAADATLRYLRKMARPYELDRVYESGNNQVSFSGWGGNFTIWFTQDEEGLGSSINVSGESPSEIDNIFSKYFDEMLFDNERDLEKSLADCFDEVSDLLVTF